VGDGALRRPLSGASPSSAGQSSQAGFWLLPFSILNLQSSLCFLRFLRLIAAKFPVSLCVFVALLFKLPEVGEMELSLEKVCIVCILVA